MFRHHHRRRQYLEWNLVHLQHPADITTLAKEFPALFRCGSSRGSTSSATFQHGVSHRPASQYLQGRQWTARTAPYNHQQRNNWPRRREQFFRTKDVVLLLDSKAENTICAPSLMAQVSWELTLEPYAMNFCLCVAMSSKTVVLV